MHSYKHTQTHDPQDLWQLAQHSEKDFLNKFVISLDLKEVRESENLRSVGKEFQTTSGWYMYPKDFSLQRAAMRWLSLLDLSDRGGWYKSSWREVLRHRTVKVSKSKCCKLVVKVLQACSQFVFKSKASVVVWKTKWHVVILIFGGQV